MSILNDLWGFANLAYKEPTNSAELVSLSEGKYDIQMPDRFLHAINMTDFAFIAEYSNRVVISFRGTDNFKALLSDINIYPLQELNAIHQGFYDGWVFFKPFIDEYLKSYNHKPIFITGHSRGAATGILCARHLAKNRDIKNISCIVYGCPRVGNKHFRDQYNKLPIDTTRVTNGYDIFTKVPPILMGFRHVGKEYWLKQLFFHKWFLKIYDHLQINYEKSLIKNKH